MGLTPSDVACTRNHCDDSELKKRIQSTLKSRVYIPLGEAEINLDFCLLNFTFLLLSVRDDDLLTSYLGDNLTPEANKAELESVMNQALIVVDSPRPSNNYFKNIKDSPTIKSEYLSPNAYFKRARIGNRYALRSAAYYEER